MMKLKWQVLVELHKFPIKWKLMMWIVKKTILKMCQVMKRVIKVDVMREMNLPFEINVDEELIKYAKDF